nr:hypothetical protein [Providencia stuartii]
MGANDVKKLKELVEENAKLNPVLQSILWRHFLQKGLVVTEKKSCT